MSDYWLGPAYPPDYPRRPPRVSAEDWIIWRRWYPTVQVGVKTLYFDVGLGPGRPAPENDPNSPYVRAWRRNTQRRADAVIVYESVIWLVELRHNASPSAVGRLLVYQNLWLKDPPLEGPLEIHLITNELSTELATLSLQHKIELHIS